MYSRLYIQTVLFFVKGIEKQCLFSMKILKLRMIASLAAINARDNYEKVFELMQTVEEIKEFEIYQDVTTTIWRPSRLRVVMGKHKTIVDRGGDFGMLLRENSGIVTPAQDFSITDKHQVIDEGVYD